MKFVSDLALHFMKNFLPIFLMVCIAFSSMGQSGPGGYGNTTDINSGLVLWLRAADANSSGDGTDVTTWDDASASGFEAIIGRSAPVWNSADGDFNGQPTLTFDGSQDDWMYIEGDAGQLNDLENTDELSVFFVFNSSSASGNKNIISKRDQNNGNQQFTFFQNNQIQSRFVTNGDAGGTITTNTTYINSATFSSGDFNHWLNQASGGGNTGGTSTLPGTNADFNIGTFNNNNSAFASGPGDIGVSGGTGSSEPYDNRTFEGRIAEIIVYRAFLNEAEKIAVENYLSAKYGAVLLTDDRWDETANAGAFNNEIAGIGQIGTDEALSATSGVLTISNAAGDPLSDAGEWLFWGHDGGDFSTFNDTNVPVVGLTRADRQWVVELTDGPDGFGDVTVSIPSDLFSGFPAVSLLVDADGNFDNASVESMTLNGSNYEATLVLEDGERLAVATESVTPGNVSGTVAFWFDANVGVFDDNGDPAENNNFVNTWSDLSSNTNNATTIGTGNGSSAPRYRTLDGGNSNLLNFEPRLDFDGSSDELDFDFSDIENTDYQIFAITQRDNTNARYLMGMPDDGNSDAFLLGYSPDDENVELQNGDGNSASIGVDGFAGATEFPVLWVSSYNGSNLNLAQIKNGESDASISVVSSTPFEYIGTPDGFIGSQGSSNYFRGDISEIIAFSTILSEDDSLALITQLAIKYGISLSHDYVDRSAGVLWEFLDNIGYTNDVAAIGSDNSILLSKKISTSGSDEVVIATSSDFESLNSDASRPELGDGDYLFVSNQGGSFDLTEDFDDGTANRMARTWLVREPNAFAGDVFVAIPDNRGPISFMLVKSGDDDFQTGSVERIALSLDQDQGYYYTNYDFEDEDYFTFSFDETEIWYSYRSANWNDWQTWTLDGAVSALLVNPDEKTPAPGDSVVIKSGQEVVVDIDNISVELMEINGTLDLSTTGGHDFGYIFGFGKLEMAGASGVDNYPDGVDTLFYDIDEGGRVEIYGTGVELDQDRTFRNLTISMDDKADIVTLTADALTIVNNLTVEQGNFQINDNSATSSTIEVQGDVLVETEGFITVSTGDARHEFDLYGDFTNQGIVEFTNFGSAQFTNLNPTNGIVDLNFKSPDQDQILQLDSITNLYRIEIDKGVDDTYVVDIQAKDAEDWNLFGYANQSHDADNQLVSALDENINALGLYFGTVKLGVNVDIPRLNGGGNYNVSEGAQIWVDGGSVAKTSGTAIVPYGTIRITSGTIDAPINSGITTRGNATLIIEGGVVTINQFRTSVFGATNQGGLVMSNGVFNVTGGSIASGYYPFNLTYEGNVFNMSGGSLNVSGANAQGGIFINSDPENVAVSGGDVNFTVNNGNDFVITSRAAFHNVNMNRASGGGEFILDGGSTGSGGANQRDLDPLPLVVINDLDIGGNSTVFDANGEDVTVTGNLTLEDGGSMLMTNNTLTFDGEGTSLIDILTSATLELDSLVIDKSSSLDLVRIDDVPSADPPIIINNYFNHNLGQFDYSTYTVPLLGNLVVSDTIGLTTSTGELSLEGTSLQTITSDGGFIYDLVSDNVGDSLSGNLVLDSLLLDAGNFDIGRHKLTIISALLTNETYGSTLMISTDGNPSDGGLEFYVADTPNNPDPIFYPIGTDANSTVRFTPATLDLQNVEDDGYAAISPADLELATLNQAGTAVLSYYWSVKQRDFTDVPDVSSIDFTYDNFDTPGLAQLEAADNFVPGKVGNDAPYSRNALASIIDLTNTFTYDEGPVYSLADENYTAGTSDNFDGVIEIYYARVTNNGDWEAPSSWSLEGPDGTAASDYPQEGDVAVISYSAVQTGDNKRRRIQIDGTDVQIAELVLEQNPDSELIENRQSRLVIEDNTGTSLTVDGTVTGDGELQYRMSTTNQPTLTFGDLGGFVNNPTASWIMRANTNGDIVVPEITDTYPRLSVVGNGGGLSNTLTFNYDFSCRNLNIRFSGTLQMGTGSGGDIIVEDSLRIGTIGGTFAGNLVFQNSGEGRTLTVGGDIILDSEAQPPSGSNDLIVEEGGVESVIHHVNVGGSVIIRDDGSNARDGDLDLFTDDTGGANAILRFFGEDSAIMSNASNNTPDLYRVIVDKGSDTTSVITIEDEVTINGANTSQPQAVEMLAGKLVLDDPDLAIVLAEMSEFIIPEGAGLEVNQGTVSMSGEGASINLDGLFRVSGTGVANLDDADIVYSNTGGALIDISGDGELNVGHQIRRPLTTSSGVLKFRQSGGTVLIGGDGESENGRGMFEVLNLGSEFTITGGTFTIENGVTGDSNPSLRLDPDISDIEGSVINLGNVSSVAGSSFFNIQSTIALDNLSIFDNADFPTVRALAEPLTTEGLFEIQAGGRFEANGFVITVNGDLDNEGSFTNSDGLTVFSAATAQEIRGGGTFTFFDFTKENPGTLTVSSTPIIVNNNLRVNEGILALGDNVMELRGDAYIESTVTNTALGILSFNSDQNNQNIFGIPNNTVTLGRVQIDNPFGVDITDGFGYNFDITEELALREGVFNVGGSLVTIKEGGIISGDDTNLDGPTAFSAFSISNMVQTNSSFVDNGLKIEFPTVQAADTTVIFPIGEQKFTPVVFTLDQNTDDGTLRVRPANERHPTINDDGSTPGQNEADSVLQYYWIVVAENITSANGNSTFYYADEDVPVIADTAKYQSARLLLNSTNWDKAYDVDDFDGVDRNFNIGLINYNSNQISGDYTAGIEPFIPAAVPVFRTDGEGGGNFSDPDSWAVPGSINPLTGPVGGRVIVEAGDEITLDVDFARLYETEIDLGATLVLDPSTVGHRLGTVSGQGTIRLEDTGDLPAGEYTDFFACNGGALDYAGTADYNVLGSISQIRKVVFSGIGERIMPNNLLEVCDTLLVDGNNNNLILELNTGSSITVGENTPRFDDVFSLERGRVELSNSTNLDINGSFVMSNGVFVGESGTSISVLEDLTRTGGNLNWNGTSVTLDGDRQQAIAGDFDAGARIFDDLTINNTSNLTQGILIDDSDPSYGVAVDGELTFIDGQVYAADGVPLRITRFGSYTGASEDSHVKGAVTKDRIANNSSYTFPIGKDNRYAPATIIVESGNNLNWTAEYFSSNSIDLADFDDTDKGSGFDALAEISANDRWVIESSASPATAQVSLTYGSWSNVADAAALRVVWYDLDTWQNKGIDAASNNAANSSGSLISEEVTSFSSQTFSIGGAGDDASLPVEMLYFEGVEDRGVVDLDWATSTEIDNDYFEVQRSQDGRDWDVIGIVTGAGSTVEQQDYDFRDFKPYVGSSYYRLRQVDFDGQFEYTEIVLVTVNLEPISFNVYPNPVRDVFTLDIRGINANEIVPYSIINLQGGVVKWGELTSDDNGRVNEQLSIRPNQSTGIYILRVETAQRIFRFNLIKK